MAAEYLGVCMTRMRLLMKQGRLRVFQFNSRTLVVRRDEVERFQKLPGGRPKLTVEQTADLKYWLENGTVIDWMVFAHPSLVRGSCRVCGVQVGTEVPSWSQGDVRVAIKHKPPKPVKMRLPGGKLITPKCTGSGLPPKGWRTGQMDDRTGKQIEPEDPRYGKGPVSEIRWRAGVKT